MLAKIFNSESRTIGGAAIVLAFFSLASRLLGVVRDRALSGQFGAGDALDAYYAAFRIPDFLYNILILGALSAGFIPVLSEALARERGKEKIWELVNNILNVILLVLAGLSAILILFAPKIVPLIAPGFGGEKLALAVTLTRIMFLSPLLLGLSSVFASVLQSYKRFLIFSLAPIFYNLGIIFGAMALVPLWGPVALAYGVVLGAALHLVIQIPSVVSLGWRYGWVFNLRNPDFKKIMTMAAPRVLALSVSQLNWFAITIIASTLAAGSLSVFNLAYNLQSFPVGILALSFAIAAFPELSNLAAKKDQAGFIKIFLGAGRQIFFLMIPASILFLMLRAQIVRVILGSGRFNWENTIQTADVLAFFTLSLFAQGLIYLLVRAFYALEDAKTPFWIGLVSVGVNIFLSIYLARFWGVVGLAMGFSVSQLVNFIFLWIFLRRRVGGLGESEIIFSVFKISMAAMGMAVMIQILKPPLAKIFNLETFFGIFGQGAIAGAAGLAVFVLAAYLLKTRELLDLLAVIRRKLWRKTAPPANLEDTSVSVS
ncbi:MAG: murein biosynthesis integral membrane protein MurJ [Patescibacteria group bacterium]